MTVDSTSATSAFAYSGVNTGTGIAKDKTSLGKDAFLQLLVTQLKYQDPSSPMDSTQMIAQTAQLSTVEQLTTLTESQQNSFALQQKLSAAQYVGETVSYTDSKGASKTGTVSAVSFAKATPEVTVGDDVVSLDSVSGIMTPAAAAAAAAAAKAAADKAAAEQAAKDASDAAAKAAAAAGTTATSSTTAATDAGTAADGAGGSTAAPSAA